MRAATLLRLALAGTRTDRLRVALTAVSAVLAAGFVLAAASVASIRGYGQYGVNLLREPGLRPGLIFALLLLTVPVLALAAQCGRLGAPARDRRLAAIRLAGATPRQALTIVAAETGVAIALGTVFAVAGFLICRAVLDIDLRPPVWGLALIVIALPLIGAAAAAVALKRVAVTPFGVARRQRTKPPSAWPGLLILGALTAFASFAPLGRHVPIMVLAVVGGALGTLGVVLGTAWIAFQTGRLVHRTARGPAALLAARRLMADPFAGSRTFAALLACVIFGAGAIAVRAWFAADFEYLGRTDTDFYFDTFRLVDAAVAVGIAIAAAGLLVTVAEGIASRRRTYAGLVAAGVPRATLARSILLQTALPLLPAIVLALAVGTSLIRGIASVNADGRLTIAFADLALLGAGAFATVLAVAALGLLTLRASTSVEELRTG